ncbi:TIGR04222 domain-containing membrane protein [Streptomyces sp. BE133]|uniref:TIGR04222 domain-containing membrane protein n=1 Tax=Streptomyces sp. BE133 TaxID=3002523 RepID=UPI002E79665C|nr:TIGR04222 domain-containing membrane protein [Streptomyces sp. BE133]MEE1809367.1 TIGR04222 domain-containing membrane protein [Streptomyces sp. BE133]
MNILAVLVDLGIVVSSVLLIVGLTRARGGSGGPAHDLFEVAFLNGGPGRVVDTALTAMQTDGRLAIGGPGIVAVQQVDARDPVERAVLQEHAMAPSGALHTLRDAVMRHPAVQEIGDGLAARGLLASPTASRTWLRWGIAQGLVCVLAIPLTAVMTAVQSVNDYAADVGFSVPFIFKVLPFLLVGFPIGFVCAAIARGRVTKAGRRAAEAYRTAHAYNPHPAHLVATHGLRALPDPVLQTQLIAAARMRPAGRPPHSGSRSSSDSSGMFVAPAVWCAGRGPGNGSCGSTNDGGSSSRGGGGGGGGGCSSGSSCGSGSSCSSGSGCGGSSGSSCSSSSGSSCGGGSSCGSSS